MSLTFTRISTKELAGVFIDTETSAGLIFKSSKDSLYLANHLGKVLVEFNALVPDSNNRGEYSFSVLGSYYPENVTEIAADPLESYIESEARYLPDLYYAMAGMGIEAPDMPSARGVYRMALGYYTHQSKFSKKALLAPCNCDCPDAIKLKEECNKEQPNHLGCPQCCDCLGQCGACGSCWSAFCSTCCWMTGCCGHDICCYDGNSIACLFPINLSCLEPYTCSRNTNCCGTPPRGEIDRCPTASFGCDCGRSGCCAEPGWADC